MTGGYNNNGHPLFSSDMFKVENGVITKVDPNDPQLPTPQLPSYKDGHCMARIDSKRVFIAGGNNKNAYIYNEITGNFTDLPNTIGERYDPACTTITTSNKMVLMVVGGHDNRDEVNSQTSAEIFDMKDCKDESISCNGKWEKQEHVLDKIGGFEKGEYVNYNDKRGLVMIGSHDSSSSRSLVNFNETENNFKELQPQMRFARWGHSAVIIPDGHITC